MTMKERIRVHVEIVNENERKLNEWKGRAAEMRTEYLPQMRLGNSEIWMRTRKPFGSFCSEMGSKDSAEKFNNEAKEAWAKVPSDYYAVGRRPTEFRIVARLVSCWTKV